jgi:hypothetical protein
MPGVKSVGKPDAGNRHVRFDERGGETGRLPVGLGTALLLDSTQLGSRFQILLPLQLWRVHRGNQTYWWYAPQG